MGLRVANLFAYIKESLKQQFTIKKEDRKKFLYLTITFFFVIAAYTIIKELKDSIFVAVVGKSYIPYAKIASMVVLIPAILFYSYLVDRLRRYQLLYVYSAIYGVLGIFFALLLAHPVIGLENTQASPWRLFGWFFYFFIEGYSPFVVSLFWAFANSVSSPEEAKNNYGIMVSGSKLGGMLSALFAWVALSQSFTYKGYLASDISKHQLLLVFASAMVLAVPLTIRMLMKAVSGRMLHGYEAAYQLEKQRAKEGEPRASVFSGLWLFIKYPYLLGVFCMVFFYEIVNTILGYQRIGIAQSNGSSLSQVSSFLFKIIFWTHFVGFLISFLGTKTLLTKLGERRCLVLIPTVTGLLLLFLMLNYTQTGLLIVVVALRALNYGFSYPVRESLYIPTVKAIKFKSKSWIDSFGSKFAKSSGSTFNMLADWLGSNLIVMSYSIFFAGLIGLWVGAAILLGRRFDRAVAQNEVIGGAD